MPRKCDLDRFFDKFKPIKNTVIDHPPAPYDGCMFETYGREEAKVNRQVKKDPKLVWTLLDCDGKLYIAPGWHYVNRMGYFITTVPFTEADMIGRSYFAG